MPPLSVAIAIILSNDGNVLICQRGQGGSFAGLWEFPGGKFEPGETPADCLRRELREELDIEVEVMDELEVVEHDYAAVRVRLHPFVCRLASGVPRPLACQQFKWIKIGCLRDYQFPQANTNLIAQVVEKYSAGQNKMGDEGLEPPTSRV